MSMPLNESSLSSWTGISRPLKAYFRPVDRAEARRRNSFTGNFRSSRIFSISSPTAPGGPIMATLYFDFRLMLNRTSGNQGIRMQEIRIPGNQEVTYELLSSLEHI